jgi:hypothetical protein
MVVYPSPAGAVATLVDYLEGTAQPLSEFPEGLSDRHPREETLASDQVKVRDSPARVLRDECLPGGWSSN